MKPGLTCALIAVFAVLCGMSGASATVITFDEFPATNNNVPLSGPYDATGASFSASNAGTWGGNSNGDRGSWGLEGTNGPQFLGFNGINNGYNETVTFSSPVSFVSADFSRSSGSSDGTITLEAFSGAGLLGSTMANLGAINTWSTLSLSFADITSIEWIGAGTDFHPYWVDNLVFTASTAVPEPATLAIFGSALAGLVVVRRRRRS
jgi:hypothetical protein